ncbi:MAG: type II toxin-antitoxin system VapC family toxin [Acidimicrobiia bacterium]|nr:type II toxin-antitoxin system VapC family toxin [Acidimicrobiia bacterium]
MFYLETSAAVKLVFAEQESAALQRWSVAVGDQVVSSDLLRTELLRVTRRVDPEQLGQARGLLDSLVLLSLSTTVCERAAVLEPVVLRSLDALHLAAALELGDDLEGVVIYDRRLREGARSLGVRAVAPA